MNRYLLLFLIASCFSLMATSSYGQTRQASVRADSSSCTLTGRVYDEVTGEPLIDVCVVVVGTAAGAMTDESGHYRIQGIPPGVYSVRASQIGYKSVEGQQHVQVSAREIKAVDFPMAKEPIDVFIDFIEEPHILQCYGAKLGASFSTWDWTMYGTAVGNLKARRGLDIGGFLEWFDTPLFSLISELHFVQKGTRFTTPVTSAQYPDGTGTNFENSFTVNDLSLGVLPKVRLDFILWEVYAVAGLRVDAALSRTATVEGPEPVRSLSEQGWQKTLDRFRGVQLGATMGMGVQYVGDLPFTVGAEARYCPNFLNDYPNSNGTIKERSFEVLLTLSTNVRQRTHFVVLP